MTQTGPIDRGVVTEIQRRLTLTTRRIRADFERAWRTYRWSAWEGGSQAQAWRRLLDFAAQLLSATAGSRSPIDPHAPAASEALHRWLSDAQTSPDDAVAWLMDTDIEPDPLLERIADAAEADLIRRSFSALVTMNYQWMPVEDRVDMVRYLRQTHAIAEEYLSGLPDWSLVDDLPTLYEICLQDERS